VCVGYGPGYFGVSGTGLGRWRNIAITLTETCPAVFDLRWPVINEILLDRALPRLYLEAS
jgi:hypothetical protein